MGVEIQGIQKQSPAARAGIKAGDILLSINGNAIADVLDYMFYAAESRLEIKLLRDEKPLNKKILKSEYDDLGLDFETFLMDNKRRCHNNCVFCFIDQMPPNMRETLYFKDDDARLSFLQGNYVTLTNLKQHDIDRIIKMRLNINVSVHTTNPKLRCEMMKNRFAGDKLDYLTQLAQSGIQMNCQIVLCPGLNDGPELERTLTDLGALMPNIQSIAVVPVGLSKFRDGLYPLEPFNRDSANAALDTIERFQQHFLDEYNTRLVFAADEFYLKAERSIPMAENYEEYPQYENGVGMIRSLEDEFDQALELTEFDGSMRNLSIATGMASAGLIHRLVQKAAQKWDSVICRVYPIVNHFFGENITVTGLVTATDLIEQLKGQELGQQLLLSSSMIRKDSDVFLDDKTIAQVEEALGITVTLVENDGFILLDRVLGL